MRKNLTIINERKHKNPQKQKNAGTVALIGYTNAGKTALLNKLARVSLKSRDRLFETLETSSKLVRLTTGQQLSFMDTVGFISRLPHELVESFKATLSEIKTANVLIHVRDISHPATKTQKEAVLSVLKDVTGIDLSKKTVKYIEVLNKMDLVPEKELRKLIKQEKEGKDYPVIPISATLGDNLNELMGILSNAMNELTGVKIRKLRIPYSQSNRRLKWLRENATLLDNSIEHDENTGDMTVKVIIDDGMLQAYVGHFNKKKY